MLMTLRADVLQLILASLAVHTALAPVAAVELASLHILRGVIAAMRRGVSYTSPAAWQQASKASTAVFCARGTLLLGEPQVAEIESTAEMGSSEILALAAGAEAAAAGPIARAVLQAARAAQVLPDAVRTPLIHAGLGVSAVTSTGDALCVGGRALMIVSMCRLRAWRGV
jgi:cation transport ATPase